VPDAAHISAVLPGSVTDVTAITDLDAADFDLE
jgi:hypothetical protein